jgi:hypothetical protein
MEEVMVRNLFAVPNVAVKMEEPFSVKKGLPDFRPQYKSIVSRLYVTQISALQ